MNVEFSVQITFPLGLPHAFTYRLPVTIAPEALIGHRAIAPLKDQLTVGIITETTPSQPTHTKDVFHIPDKTPIFPPTHLRFLHWISTYYLCPLGSVIRAALLPEYYNLQLSLKQPIQTLKVAPEEQSLLQALAKEPLTYTKALHYLPSDKRLPAIKRLVSQKAIALCRPYTPQQKAIALSHDFFSSNGTLLEEKLSQSLSTPAQKKLCHTYLSLRKALNNPWISQERLLQEGISLQMITRGSSTNLWHTQDIPWDYHPSHHSPNLPTLTPSQEAILSAIEQKKYQGKAVAFLPLSHDKSQESLYRALALETLRYNKTNILLVPNSEALHHWQERLHPILGDKLLVWPQKSIKTKKRHCHRLKQHHPLFLLATPSLLLHPFHHIHRITVTQEASPDYKRAIGPRYHGRDIAIICAQQYKAQVLLTSVTPSIESYHNIQKGKYASLRLPHIGQEHTTPSLTIITRPRKNLILTPALINTLEKALAKKEKIVILHPRRGYTAYTSCPKCYWQATCPSCNTGLVHHQKSQKLHCHHCEQTFPIPYHCPACQCTQLQYSRVGTQQLAESLTLQIPHLRLARIDQDATPHPSKYKKTLAAFRQGTLDALIGTHRLIRALPNIDPNLILWVDPHHWTANTDFRSTLYQRYLLQELLAHKKVSTLLLSIPAPLRSTITPLIQEPNTFYPQTLQACKTHGYPPYVKVVNIAFQHPKKAIAMQAAHQLTILLQAKYPLKILGPSTTLSTPKAKHAKVTLWVYLTHKECKKALPKLVQSLVQKAPYRQVNIQFDVDP